MLAATLIHNRNAPPDCTIAVVVGVCRNSRSARASGHRCPRARLLPAQRRPPVPRFSPGIRSALPPRCQLLQPRRLPRRNHFSVGARPADDHSCVRPRRRSPHRRIAHRDSRREAILLAIYSRPSANLHRL